MKKPNMFVMMKQVEKQLQDYKDLLIFLTDQISLVNLEEIDYVDFFDAVNERITKGGDAA